MRTQVAPGIATGSFGLALFAIALFFPELKELFGASEDSEWSTVLQLFAVLLAGGSVTLGGLTFQAPGTASVKKWIFREEDKDWLVDDVDIMKRLMTFRSFHLVTVLFAIKRDGELVNAKIEASNPAADGFYGYSQGETVGKSSNELGDRLKEFMDEADFEDFANDQGAIIRQWLNGKVAYAKVPVKFNDSHPIPTYQNKKYLPLIVQLTPGEPIDGVGEVEYLTVLYLDVDLIPKSIFDK